MAVVILSLRWTVATRRVEAAFDKGYYADYYWPRTHNKLRRAYFAHRKATHARSTGDNYLDRIDILYKERACAFDSANGPGEFAIARSERAAVEVVNDSKKRRIMGELHGSKIPNRWSLVVGRKMRILLRYDACTSKQFDLDAHNDWRKCMNIYYE